MHEPNSTTPTVKLPVGNQPYERLTIVTVQKRNTLSYYQWCFNDSLRILHDDSLCPPAARLHIQLDHSETASSRTFRMADASSYRNMAIQPRLHSQCRIHLHLEPF